MKPGLEMKMVVGPVDIAPTESATATAGIAAPLLVLWAAVTPASPLR